MNTSDILLSVIICIIFILLNLGPILSVGLQNVQQNWVKYRCNPIVIPFAGLFGENPSETFNFCVQNMVKELMKFLLIPTEHAMSVIQNTGGGLVSGINNVRKTISSTRSNITDIVQSIFGVLLNILVEFQKIFISMKDLIGKFVGIMTSLLFLVNGSMMSMQSAWAGPPGKLTKALCFSPKTELLLVNNVVKEMQELELGDTLEDGSIVEGIIKLQNTTNEMFYSFDGEELLVTGSHMILGPTNTFIPVHKHPLAKLQNSSSPILYCLITSTHLIKIGNYTFWDWDDDDLH